MKIRGVHYRTIWLGSDGRSVSIIDQTKLPHFLEIKELKTIADAAQAIRSMQVRGAPLIGVAAAYGLCLALNEDASDESFESASAMLASTRPTAVNLKWALGEMREALRPVAEQARLDAAYAKAAQLAEEDVENCRSIGDHGQALIAEMAARKGRRVNILTHCNAGWLACIDWGTALSPIYRAYDAGIPVHVWVSETRPRNQGTALSAFELGAHGIPHTIIADNAGGHLMQRGEVDLCIVGCDRLTACFPRLWACPRRPLRQPYQ